MLRVILIIAVGVGTYLYFSSATNNPDSIADPVYAEIRINQLIQGREFNHVLFAEMVDHKDCIARAAIVWTKALASCKTCEFKKTECRDAIPGQYRAMFDNRPIDTTYLSAERGSRFERNGRIIIWGLTGPESVMVCDMLQKALKENYQGTAECIHARES